MDTVCQNCYFAEFEGVTQIGCKLNLLNKYIDAGIAVEAYNDEVIDRENFYILKDHLCVAGTNRNFVKDNNLTEEQVISHIQQKMKFQWQAIVLLHDEDVSKCLESISNQAIPPENVTVVMFNNSTSDSADIVRILAEKKYKTWRLMEAIDDSLPKESYIDMVLDKYQCRNYVVMNASDVLEDGFTDRLNRFIIEEVVAYGVIEVTDSVKVYSTMIHKALGGNSFGVKLEDKLIGESCQHLILKLK